MDERGIVRALQNVVQNAIQHPPPGGVVEVELKADGHWSVCTVRDRGGGFAARTRAASSRPSSPPRRDGPACARTRVVEEHGGQVWRRIIRRGVES
jgi:signal transduction histidine kinase